jgi:hypothetical protein
VRALRDATAAPIDLVDQSTTVPAVKRWSALTQMFATATLLSVATVWGQSVDFDTPNDLATKFNVRPGTSNTYYSQITIGGITGGAVDVYATLGVTDTVFFKTSTPSPGGATLRTSLFFRYDSTIRDSTAYGFPIVLGFSRVSTTSGYTSSPTQGVDAGVYLETYNDTTERAFPVLFGAFNETHTGTTGTLVSGHWYRLILDLQRDGTNGQRALLSTTLADFGSTGQAPPVSFAQFSQSVFAFADSVPTELYPAFRSFKSGGADLLDNFSVSTLGTLPVPSRLANISTRGRVEGGDNALIAGVIVQGETSKRLIFRALGPSLGQFGVTGLLGDPVLTLYDATGAILAQNDDWRTTQEQEIIATQIPPPDDRESAIVITLPPASYTSVVTGANGVTGVGLVEVYDLD